MKLTIGSPQVGMSIEIEIPLDAGDEEVEVLVANALETLDTAGRERRSFALAHETDEEREVREIMERNARLEKERMRRSNIELGKILYPDGKMPL